jgi:Tn3 transposase DDE domain
LVTSGAQITGGGSSVSSTRGEALHSLRELLLIANKGTLRKKQEEELRNQVGCRNLVTNAVATWNMVYMAAVIEQLRAEGKAVNERTRAGSRRLATSTSTRTASTASRSGSG